MLNEMEKKLQEKQLMKKSEVYGIGNGKET